MRIYTLQQYYLLPLIFCVYHSMAQNSTPVAGPRPPLGHEFKTLPMSIVLDLLEFELHSATGSINMMLANQKDSTGLEAQLKYSYRAGQPFMAATTYQDRPNHYYIKVPLIITYNVQDIKWYHNPYPSRKIHQFVDLIITCNNWFTNDGALHYSFEMQKPYADDRPSPVQALNFYIANNLTTLLDGKIRTTFPEAFRQSHAPLAACNCLDVKPGTDQANHYKDSEIRYNMPKALPADHENIEISLLSFKRLYAHTYPDFKVLYQEEEDIELEFYVNQVRQVITINKMREEQEYQLNIGKIIFPKTQNEELLVHVANLKFKQLPEYKKTTEVLAFNKLNNFGHGLHKIVFYKSYNLKLAPLPSGEMPHPYEVKLPAYELTLRINVKKPEAMARN